MAEDLKNLTYAVDFSSDNKGLTDILEIEEKIDSGFEKIMETASGLESIFDKIGNGNGMKGVTDTFENINKSAAKTNEELSEQEEHNERIARLTDLVNKYADEHNSKLEQGVGVAEQLSNRTEQLSKPMSEIIADQQKLNEEIEKSASEEDKLKSNTDTTASAMKSLNTVSGLVGRTLATFGIIGIGNSLVQGIEGEIKSFTKFQQTMATVHATLGDVTNKDLNSLADQAINISNKYGIASSEIAQGEDELASHGLNAKQIMDTIQPSTLLAVAGNIKMKDSTLDVSAALRNFNLDMSKAGHVADVYAAAAADTAAAMPDMAQALKNVAPIAGEVGYSIEQTAADIGALADKGIKGGVAGTDLKIMIERLITPLGKGADLIHELGFKAVDPTTGKLKDMSTVVRDLNKAFESHGLTTAPEKNSALSLIFGKEALPGTAAIFGTAPDQLDKLTKKLENSNGAAENMADTMNDTVQGSLNKLKSKVDNVFTTDINKTQLGKSMKSFLDSLNTNIPWISNNLTWFLNTGMKVGSGIKSNWGGISSIVVGIAGAFVTLKGAMAIEGVIKTLGGLKKALPTIGEAGGIGLIASGFMEIHEGNTGLGNLLIATGAGLIAVSKGIGLVSGAGIGLVAYGFMEIHEGNTGLGSLLVGTGAGLVAIQKGLTKGLAIAALGQAFIEIKEGNKGLGALLIGTAAGLFIVQAAGGPVSILIGVLAAGAALIIENWGPVSKFFVDTFATIKSAATDVANWVIEKLNGAITSINNVIQTVNKIPGINIDTIKPFNYVGDKKQKENQNTNKSTVKYAAASGTDNHPGGMTLVGEKGPELLNIPKGSQILPNNMLGGLGGIGTNMTTNMGNGIISGKQTVDLATEKVVQSSKGILNNFAQLNTVYGQSSMKNLSEAVTNKQPLMNTAVTKVSTDNKGILNNFSQSGNVYGTGVVKELTQGVASEEGNLTAEVKTLTDKVISAFKSGFGIHSPSRVMFQMGSYLMQGLVNGMTAQDMEGFIKQWIGSMASAASGSISGSLSTWITAAMAITGVSSDWFGPLAEIIQHESGGDPNNINLWDYNAQHGDPSIGLMQLTGENMRDFHLPGLDDIRNPVANIAAGIRYIQSRYGNAFNVPGVRALAEGRPYVGYATGTNNAAPGVAMVGEKGPELVKFGGGEQVIPNNQLSARSLSPSTGNRNVQINVEAPQINVNIDGSNGNNASLLNELDNKLSSILDKHWNEKFKMLKAQLGI